MNRLTMILAVVILPAWVLPAPADGIFGVFGKKTKVEPAKRVPELIFTLKTEQDERKRSSAAAELGAFDAAAFPEIVPVLVDILQHDSKSGVRMDAASSLGSLRPISQVVGESLEKTASSDDNLRVRLHAKSILMKYRVAGYSPNAPKTNPSAPRTFEPPLIGANATKGQQNTIQGSSVAAQFPTGPNPFTNTATTKITAPKNGDTPEFRPSVPRPLPQGPAFSTAMPQGTIQTAPPALPMVEVEGPPLIPPPPRTQTPPPAPPVPPPPAPVSPF